MARKDETFAESGLSGQETRETRFVRLVHSIARKNPDGIEFINRTTSSEMWNEMLPQATHCAHAILNRSCAFYGVYEHNGFQGSETIKGHLDAMANGLELAPQREVNPEITEFIAESE